jgi:hypothetical protein
MSIENLEKVIRFSGPAIYSDRGKNWQEVQTTLGVLFPGDYKAFISRYGSGCLGEFIWIFNPFTNNPNLSLQRQAKVRIDAVREFNKAVWQNFPFGLFPEPGGLFPFGATDNGDVLYWLCEGEADHYSVVLCDSRAPKYEKFDVGMTDFLADVLSRKLKCNIFPDDFPSENPSFVPENLVSYEQ